MQKINPELNIGTEDTIAVLKKISEIAKRREMKFNTEKTKFMLITPERCQDIPRIEVIFEGRVFDKTEEKLRVLGCLITSNLSTHAHISKNARSARIRIRLLKQLNTLEVHKDHVLTVYKSIVRSVLEFGISPFTRMIPHNQMATLERVQRCALKIILGDHPYRVLLSQADVPSIKDRCEGLFERFLQSLGNSGLAGIWERAGGDGRVLRRVPKMIPNRCRTNRSQQTPLNVLRNANTFWTPERKKYKTKLTVD
jgi:hypothetical protein